MNPCIENTSQSLPYDPNNESLKWDKLIKKGGLMLKAWPLQLDSLLNTEMILSIRENLLNILKGD